jgi:hypothetical protein
MRRQPKWLEMAGFMVGIHTKTLAIDIMPKISGVEFESAWQRRVTVAIDDTLTVTFISRDDLLAAKIAAGRAQDLADVVA